MKPYRLGRADRSATHRTNKHQQQHAATPHRDQGSLGRVGLCGDRATAPPLHILGQGIRDHGCDWWYAEKRKGHSMAGRPGQVRKQEFVSATAMARHLCLDRGYQDRLVSMGVIMRREDGTFDLDDNRRRYILHLREERKRSPKSEADAEFQKAKADPIRLRIAEKQRRLIDAEETFAQIDEMVGMFLTGLSGFAARCGGRDPGYTPRHRSRRYMTCGLRYPKRRPSPGRINAASPALDEA